MCEHADLYTPTAVAARNHSKTRLRVCAIRVRILIWAMHRVHVAVTRETRTFRQPARSMVDGWIGVNWVVSYMSCQLLVPIATVALLQRREK